MPRDTLKAGIPAHPLAWEVEVYFLFMKRVGFELEISPTSGLNTQW
jgi:hypothetical protein